MIVKEMFKGLDEPKIFLEIDRKHDYRLFPEAVDQVNQKLKEFTGKYL